MSTLEDTKKMLVNGCVIWTPVEEMSQRLYFRGEDRCKIKIKLQILIQAIK